MGGVVMCPISLGIIKCSQSVTRVRIMVTTAIGIIKRRFFRSEIEGTCGDPGEGLGMGGNRQYARMMLRILDKLTAATAL
jgi:hypothetical protein